MNVLRVIIRLLLGMGTLLLVWVSSGCLITFIVSWLYTQGPNYCRDCNTGLGLVCISFSVGTFLTPVVLYFIPFLDQEPKIPKRKKSLTNNE